MLAPNLVYATVAGRYPRLLADDGVHEPLVLPYDVDTTVPFQFYEENANQPLTYADIIRARYWSPDGVMYELPIAVSPFIVEFPASLPAGGVCVLDLHNGASYQCYPFRVLRPSLVQP